MKIEVLLPSLSEFYQETEIVECDNKSSYWEHKDGDDSYFTGLPLSKILKHKYSYTEGLDKLKEIEGDVNIGGNSRKYVWNDFDGDDMSYDRYIEGLPCMHKRIRTCGIGSGRIVTIHVNISEFGGTNYNDMLNKAYTTIQIIDFLENLGYRVGVNVYDATGYLGHTSEKKGHQPIEYIKVEIPLKQPEEPLNKALLLTAISPWFERYWMFLYHKAKFNCNCSMGKAVDERLPDTMTDIYIKQGECLCKKHSNAKIKELKAMFTTQFQEIV